MSENIPYGFVPISVDAKDHPCSVTDAPVFHDGEATAGFLSGELRCTLRALTPLIVGNDHYNAEEAYDPEKREAVSTVRDGNDPEKYKVALPKSWGIGCPVARDKTVIEPLRLDDGRVAIAGTALKGMLRNSLSALLAAPMERVTECTFSYRPNLEFPGEVKRLREPRAAVVEKWDEAKQVLILKVLPFAALRNTLFVRDQAANRLPVRAWGKPPGETVAGVTIDKGKRRLVEGNIGSEKLDQYLYFHYRGGSDGCGELANAYGERENCPVHTYKHVLVREDDYCRGTIAAVSGATLEMHRKTTDHLLGHHLHAHPLAKHIEKRIGDVKRGFEGRETSIRDVGQLIYVEIEWCGDDEDADGEENGRGFWITSLGQNYRYRWRFTDSVREHDGQRRAILSPLADELTPGRPQKLSAARLLFGYVSDKDFGTDKLGGKEFRRFAGRLAFNIAVEQTDTPKDNTRFLDKGCAIPLNILGSPKPSAYEEYLQQTTKRKDASNFTTYGDISGDPAGKLAGRKFYYHQPPAADHCDRYRVTDEDTTAGNQAALVRFVSKPVTKFRFTLRFEDLRPWELGAVLVALDPARLEGEATPKDDTNPEYALKLGHGRPLGLGSVAVSVDSVDLVNAMGNPSDGTPECEKAIKALRAQVGSALNDSRKAWLALHQYRGREKLEYPRDVPKKWNNTETGRRKPTVFNYYTNNRRAHSVRRREDPRKSGR